MTLGNAIDTRSRAQGMRLGLVHYSNARQEFLAHDLSVFHRVNANFRQWHSLFRVFVGYVGIVLHHEAIVSDVWFARFETVHLHVLLEPFGFATHTFDAARFGRTTIHRPRFHAHDVFIIERVDRFLKRLFSG